MRRVLLPAALLALALSCDSRSSTVPDSAQIVLFPGATGVSGSLMDRKGPVEGAVVTAYSVNPANPNDKAPLNSAVTDSSGRYLITDLPVGVPLVIIAAKAGYRSPARAGVLVSFAQLTHVPLRTLPESPDDLLGGLEGFGSATTGGEGGPVLRVTSLADSGPGTLRELASLPGPAIIRFDVNGLITPSKPIKIKSNKTIDGRSASITLSGHGLHLKQVSNIIIANLTIIGAEDDGIEVEEAHHVWIDHCTLAACGDGLIDVVNGSDWVTISWCRFDKHNKVMLIGNSDNKDDEDIGKLHVTLHHNWFNRTTQRHPRIRFGQVDTYNNWLLDWKSYGMASACEGQLLMENNVFEAGADPEATKYMACSKNPDYEKGFGRAVGNLGYGGAIIQERKPEKVFERPYAACIEFADNNLRWAVEAGAGAMGPASGPPVAPHGVYDDAPVTPWAPRPWLQYAGNWTHWTEWADGAFGKTLSTSEQAGAKVSLEFSGTQVIYWFTRAWNRGVASVRIDGVEVEQVDLSSPQIEWRRNRTYKGLSPGLHTLEIVVLSGIVDVDAITVVGPQRGFDDSSNRLLWDGSGWVHDAGPWSALASGGTASWTSKVGDDVSLRFFGSSISWVNALAWNRGLVSVLIDGAVVASVTATTPEIRWRGVRTWSVATGWHTVKLKLSGTGHLDLDALVVDRVAAGSGLSDDAEPGLDFAGNWTFDVDEPWSQEAIAKTISRSNQPTASASLTFVGDQVTWWFTRAWNRGTAVVTIDGVDQGSFDLYSSAIEWQASVVFDDLGPGEHTITVTVVDGWVDVDGFTVDP